MKTYCRLFTALCLLAYLPSKCCFPIIFISGCDLHSCFWFYSFSLFNKFFFQVFLEWIRENLFINYPLLIQTLIDRHPLRSQHQQTQPASTELRPVPFIAWNRVWGVWVQWLTLWQLSWTLLLGSSEEMFKISWLNRFLVCCCVKSFLKSLRNLICQHQSTEPITDGYISASLKAFSSPWWTSEHRCHTRKATNEIILTKP